MNYSKEFKSSDYYNIHIDFNRLEKYNEYVETWLKNVFEKSFNDLIHKTDWTINDDFYLSDFNRVKRNLNTLLVSLESETSQLTVNDSINQRFDYIEANKLEACMTENLRLLGELQFKDLISGNTYCGDELFLGI